MAELKRALGLFSCTMLVAGNMIGVGIFVTAGRIANLLPDPSLIVAVWLAGGLLSLAGSLAYAELATRYPRAGGGYVYLREAFGPLFGFLAGFSSSMVTIPGTAAFLAIGFTKYAGILDPFAAKAVAVFLILSISLVNFWGAKWGAELQNVFMLIKLFLILGLVFFGFFSGQGSFQNFSTVAQLPVSVWVALPLAMVPVMYTYSGWDATVYVAGEVKNPQRTIPLSLFFGTLMVTGVYLALACLYIYAIAAPVQGQEPRIVTAAARVLFGQTIGNVIGGLVAVSMLGCLAATILTGPRVIFAMARDGLLPKAAAEIHPVYASPAKAIWFHGFWSCLLAVTGTFDQLLDYVTVPYMFFSALAAAGLFVLRARNAKDEGAAPYLSFGFPVLPALFSLGMMWIVVNSIYKHPQDSLWGLLIVSLGVPVYVVWKKWGGGAGSPGAVRP